MTTAIHFSVVIPAYNSAGAAAATLGSLRSMPGGDALEIIVVDDASPDGIDPMLDELRDNNAVLVRHNTNRGRSAARNSGVAAAHGTHILFIDMDARPVGDRFLITYEQAIATNANLVFGAYTSARSDFWSRYEAVSLHRAITRFRDGARYSMSSRNFLIERALFEACGGFDERYRHYGFEDRDLFVRALAAGARPTLAEGAIVRHAGDVTLPVVMRKMREAGQHSARLFRHDHPKAYAQLGYRSIDARDHPTRAAVAAPITRMMTAVSDRLERVLQSEHVPFGIRAYVAQAGSAMSYMDGTRDDRSTDA